VARIARFPRLRAGEEARVVDFGLVEKSVRVDVRGDREAALPDGTTHLPHRLCRVVMAVALVVIFAFGLS
jgi:hypothetical protein